MPAVPTDGVVTASGLLDLAVSRPREALDAATELLAGQDSPAVVSVAHQARGVVHRDAGDLDEAVRDFRLAIRFARRARLPDRECDILASLGVALVMSGRIAAGLSALDKALRTADPRIAARVLLRRGGIMDELGRRADAVADCTHAEQLLTGSGDEVWRARALLNRGMARIGLGQVDAAAQDARSAEVLFSAAGQELEAAKAVHNRGLVANLSGHLPAALALLALAEQRYAALDVQIPELPMERSAILLRAGLPNEAREELEPLLDSGGSSMLRPEVLVACARAALAAGDARAARSYADRATGLFRRQRRDWWAARALLVSAEARYAAGERSARLLQATLAAAVALSQDHPDEEPLAHLLVGRLARARGEPALAATHLAAAAGPRRRGPALMRATGWLAQALRTEGDQRLRACGRGLDALDEHRLTLGCSELRALATGHGRELAALAVAQALPRGPRTLLRWSERWRATALAVPPVTPPDDDALAGDLASLRDAVRRLEEARADGSPTAAQERERDHQEATVRRRQLQLSGGGTLAARLDVDELLATLGERTLVSLVEVSGVLHALIGHGNRVVRHEVGPAASAVQELGFAAFALRRAAHGRAPDLVALGARLQQVLLGPAAGRLGDGPVVVVPPGRLLGVPWGLLPALRDRSVTVGPSAALWLQARATEPPPDRRVVLVAGPGLGSGGGEVSPLATRYGEAVLLRDGRATVDRVLAALDGAWLAHVAAHGSFRADSPMFSSLGLDDGPLTVHDLERLRRAPYRLVLSACDSGVAAPVGADELLGLVSGLLPLGTAGLLASVAPVNDAATVPLMLALHDALDGGADLPEALLAARRTMTGDPVAEATGAAFIALGT